MLPQQQSSDCEQKAMHGYMHPLTRTIVTGRTAIAGERETDVPVLASLKEAHAGMAGPSVHGYKSSMSLSPSVAHHAAQITAQPLWQVPAAARRQPQSPRLRAQAESVTAEAATGEGETYEVSSSEGAQRRGRGMFVGMILHWPGDPYLETCMRILTDDKIARPPDVLQPCCATGVPDKAARPAVRPRQRRRRIHCGLRPKGRRHR